LIRENNANITGALTKAGVPHAAARKVAASFGAVAPSSGGHSGQSHALVHDVQLAFAHSTQTVFYIMAGVMAATFLGALAPAWTHRTCAKRRLAPASYQA
jgi:hypothetical protein